MGGAVGRRVTNFNFLRGPWSEQAGVFESSLEEKARSAVVRMKGDFTIIGRGAIVNLKHPVKSLTTCLGVWKIDVVECGRGGE